MITLDEFRELLRHINEGHSFKKGKGKKIKYIEPIIDMRTGKIFAIKFRGWHDKEFAIVNENRNKNLLELVKEWLDE